MKEKIISEYGRALRKGSIKTIVDFNESLKIDFNFQLHNINDLVNEFNGVMPPNRLNHYIIAFIQQGEGRKTIGNYSFEIQPNYGLIFPKNVIHSTNKWSLDTKGYMLSFDDTLFNEFQFPKSFLQLPELFKLSAIPYKEFEKKTSKNIVSLFEELETLKSAREQNERKIFILKLSELLLIYQKEFIDGSKKANPANVLFDRFVESLESNYRSNREVRFYSDILCVHPNHLNKIVRSCSGSSSKEYIINRVFQEAKYLLSATSIPIKEIAYDLGFADYNYFCRLFKSYVEQTPQQYRTSNT